MLVTPVLPAAAGARRGHPPHEPAGAVAGTAVATTDSDYFPPGSWQVDADARFRLAPLIRHFHRSVPVLKHLGWTIEAIERGYARSRLPLNVASSNQYVTQQAALMLLAADYTGGIALATLLKDTPIIGFHPQRTAHGAYLWGAAAGIKWLRPSTSDLVVSSRIHERQWDDAARTFEQTGELSFKARIRMASEQGELVAVSDFQYWARSSSSLRATGATLAATHHMLRHRLCTSARLIAGLRALQADPSDPAGGPLDPCAASAAGPQGRAMAEKFSLDTPQLGELVRARTLACDAELRAFARRHADGVVVNIGCGLDARPWRMKDIGRLRFVELDLPVMLKEREAVLPPAEQAACPVTRGEFDVLADDLGDVLARLGVPAGAPRFFIWEGGSMYFEPAPLRRLLGLVRAQMCGRSLLWLDFPSARAVHGRSEQAEVETFMENMRVLGEPFVWGADDASELADMGFDVLRCVTAAEVNASADPVQRHYRFATCAKAA